MSSITFVCTPVVPFRLDVKVWALRRRVENAIDRWDGQTYRRALAEEGYLRLGPVLHDGERHVTLARDSDDEPAAHRDPGVIPA